MHLSKEEKDYIRKYYNNLSMKIKRKDYTVYIYSNKQNDEEVKVKIDILLNNSIFFISDLDVDDNSDNLKVSMSFSVNPKKVNVPEKIIKTLNNLDYEQIDLILNELYDI